MYRCCTQCGAFNVDDNHECMVEENQQLKAELDKLKLDSSHQLQEMRNENIMLLQKIERLKERIKTLKDLIRKAQFNLGHVTLCNSGDQDCRAGCDVYRAINEALDQDDEAAK